MRCVLMNVTINCILWSCRCEN